MFFPIHAVIVCGVDSRTIVHLQSRALVHQLPCQVWMILLFAVPRW